MYILVVCRSNRCRSPIAEALIRRELKARGICATVRSAGLDPTSHGLRANEHAIKALFHKENMDISAHRSLPVKILGLAGVTHAFCMDHLMSHELASLGIPSEKIHLFRADQQGIPSPFSNRLEEYEALVEIFAEEAKNIATNLQAETTVSCSQ